VFLFFRKFEIPKTPKNGKKETRIGRYMSKADIRSESVADIRPEQ
jgi:hypothetical protein